MKKMVWLIGLAVIVVFFLVGCSKKDSVEPIAWDSAEPIAWDSALSEAGFTDDEIASYREVFDAVGVTDFHDISIIDNDPMTVICGKIYDSEDLQLNVTLENHQIIYVELAGIPDTKTQAYFNWRGKVKWKTVNTKKAVELYSDTEGGYLGVLDWDNKTILEYKG